MNNTVENGFFGFPKVKWLQYTGEGTNVQATDVKFSQDLMHQKSLKSVNFLAELFEKLKGGRFLAHSLGAEIIILL